MSRNNRNNQNSLYKWVETIIRPLANTLYKDEKIERQVLSTIINDTEKQSLGLDYLVPEAFFNLEYSTLFRFLKTRKASEPNQNYIFDYNTLLNEIPKFKAQNPSLEWAPLSIETLNKVVSTLSSDENFLPNVEKLIELHKRRQAEAFFSNYLSVLGQNPKITWEDIVTDLENFIISSNNLSIKNSEFISLESALEKYFSGLKNDENEEKALLTEFNAIDKYVKGFKPGQLIILAARPGVGKTALALNIARNIIEKGMKDGKPKNVAFISLEMPTSELTTRYLATSTLIDMYKLQNIKLLKNNYEDLMKIHHVVSSMQRTPDENQIWFDDDPKSKINEIIFKIKHLIKNTNKVDLIVIDYLQLISGGNQATGNRQNEVAMISRSLKTLALELKIPIIALSQLSRSVENREDKRPQLSDLRESGSIEQDADIVIFLSRKKLKKSAHSNDDEVKTFESIPVTLSVAKNRNGEPGQATLIYTGKYVQFLDDMTNERGGF
ncbi:DnaB-like helicase C-terminal domain-containing protein [Mycoplasma sp. 1232]|uniref:DnaB-like helicase C-terminal domain-containing protein n=1 Tax=Mycoplasma sp. 1232 TaxID=3108527 RepID=UPI002B257EF7|nr:DnaB-like helicase C-terminal domain-containing protein [Mycoplasma sp. 1232]MEA4333599.1 DnaB-like helicase C-terminal domain-containing protein [Mycoplasma sp. 1232]